MFCVIVHDKYHADCVHALNFCAFVFFLCFFVSCIIMPAIDCDNGWPAFDGCMPFWQPSCITNFCLVIVHVHFVMENKLSLSSLYLQNLSNTYFNSRTGCFQGLVTL